MKVPTEELRIGDRVQYQDGWCEHSGTHQAGKCGADVHVVSYMRWNDDGSRDGGLSVSNRRLTTICECGCGMGTYYPGQTVRVTKRSAA